MVVAYPFPAWANSKQSTKLQLAQKQTLRTVWIGLVLIGFLLGGSGCTSAPTRQFKSKDFKPQSGQVQRGFASWYGPGYRGKPTASGEKFNPKDLTAAHRTLGFGSIVEVHNLQNGRKVLVEINDRGPFIAGRIIDLSERAARDLGMVAAGVVMVEIRLMRPK